MAHVEKHHRKPCVRCEHAHTKHASRAPRCAVAGCSCSGWRSQPGDLETWRARWIDPAGKERAKTFRRKVDAEQHLVSVEDAKLRGAYVDPQAGKVLLGEWAERWYQTTAALKPSTQHDYRALLDHQVLPAFRDVPLSGLDTLAVREWLADLIAGGLSAKRARKAHQILSQLLDRAVEGRRISRNVAAGIKLPKVQKREMPFLDADQAEALAEAIDPRFRTLIRFAAYTGLRPCELVALRVRRLDLLRGTVRVAEAAPEVAGRLEWGSVKTHEARTVHLPRSIVTEVGAHLARRPHGPDDLVFTAPLGGPLRESKFVPVYFKPAIVAANQAITRLPATSGRPDPIPGHLRFYDLRHTCASLLIREGASIKAVQAQLGHATAAITLDVYGHLFPSELETLGERLDRVRAEALGRRLSNYRRTLDGPNVLEL
jgi:integrase